MSLKRRVERAENAASASEPLPTATLVMDMEDGTFLWNEEFVDAEEHQRRLAELERERERERLRLPHRSGSEVVTHIFCVSRHEPSAPF